MMKTQSNGQLPVASGSTANEVRRDELKEGFAQIKAKATKQRQESEKIAGGPADRPKKDVDVAAAKPDQFEKASSPVKTNRVKSILTAPWTLSRTFLGRS